MIPRLQTLLSLSQSRTAEWTYIAKVCNKDRECELDSLTLIYYTNVRHPAIFIPS